MFESTTDFWVTPNTVHSFILFEEGPRFEFFEAVSYVKVSKVK
jgi:hypothetical protein